MISVHAVIEAALTQSPSDLHLSVGVPPVCRFNGQLVRMNDFGIINSETMESWLAELLSQNQLLELRNKGDLDISLTPVSYTHLIRPVIVSDDELAAVIEQFANLSAAVETTPDELDEKIPSFIEETDTADKPAVILTSQIINSAAVSYTHLDVYKRQRL